MIRIKNRENMKMAGTYVFTIRDAETGRIKRVYRYKNILPIIGRKRVLEALAGLITNVSEIKINETSLGTGTTPPSNNDTQLETEVYRKAVASVAVSNNILYLTAFYTATEVSGNFKEAGLHINGTGQTNSGLLFSRVAIDISKSLTETLTIDYTLKNING